MFELWWIALVAVALVVAYRVLGTGGLSAALKQTRKSGDISPIVAAVEAAPEKKHPNMWDQAIANLWQSYEREAALAVMMAAAARSEAPVVQFWLKNAMEVEPKMAEQFFTEEFLEQHFKPDVAASCGRVSCCM